MRAPNLRTLFRHVKVVLVQTARDLVNDDVAQHAAAVAYYALLSALPLLLATVAIAGYFVDSHWLAHRVVALVGDLLPNGQEKLHALIEDAISSRGTTGLLSILVFLFAGSRVFSSLTRALNIAYDVDEPYGFWKRLALDVSMLLTVGLLFVIALSSGWVYDAVAALFDLPTQTRRVSDTVFGWALPTGMLLLAFFLLYRFVPRARHKVSGTRSAAVGAVVATGGFLIAKPIFAVYLDRFSNFNVLYGSLAIAIILLVWAWVIAWITLVGGEIASHVQMMIEEGRSAREVERRHEERSPQKHTHEVV